MNFLLKDQQDFPLQELKEINPSLCKLKLLLEERGYKFSYHNDAGEYGYYLFEYKGAVMGIWIDSVTFINIFYPNWAIIHESQLKQEIISAVQSYILNNETSIYWLSCKGHFTFSSNIALDSTIIEKVTINYIENKLEKLYFSKNNLLQILDSSSEIMHKEEVPKNIIKNPESKKDLIIKNLVQCDCDDIEIDDDGDINFNYNGHHMHVKLVSDSCVKIVYFCFGLNYVDEVEIEDDSIDMNALAIQWNNMIYPAKCTYYKPDERMIYVTATFNVELLHFEKEWFAFIKQVLHILSNTVENDLMELISPNETGDEIVNTWFQPQINNY